MAKRAQKQRQRAQRLLDPLLERLSEPGASDDVATFLGIVQEWLTRNLGSFAQEERRLFRLDAFAAMQLDDLPTGQADFDPAVALARLRDEPPSSIGEVGMSIGTMFWEGVTVWSRRVCPQCGSLLRVLQEAGNPGRLGYACDVCPWAEDEDRSEWQAEGILVPATTEALRRRGLLLRSV